MKSCDLARNILRAIQLVNNTGLHTIAFVMDNGPNNMSAVNEMKVMDDTISVDGEKDLCVCRHTSISKEHKKQFEE